MSNGNNLKDRFTFSNNVMISRELNLCLTFLVLSEMTLGMHSLLMVDFICKSKLMRPSWIIEFYFN